MTLVIVMGASSAYGVGDSQGGWATRLRKHFYEKDPTGGFGEVYNCAIPGDTTTGMFKRFDSEVAPRATKNHTDKSEIVIIFHLGTNDTAFLHNEKRNVTSKEEFEQNIRELVKKARQYTSHVLFFENTQVNETRTNSRHGRKKSYLNSYIDDYNKIIQQICEELDIPFIETIELVRQLHASDGLHLNNDGHELLCRRVIRELEDQKLI